jgi:drug/metabolite transporter (DMT)-like permease
MKKDRLKAIIFILIAAVLWSTGGLLIKLVDWNPMAIAGTRSGIAAMLMFAWIRKPFKLEKPKIIGSLFYCVTVIAFVAANKMTAAANVIVLQYSAPIWVALICRWVLKERISAIDWGAIAFVMGGIMLFFVGDIEMGQLTGNLLAIVSGIALAGFFVSMKFAKSGSPIEVPLVGNIMAFIICIPFIFRSMPDVRSLIALSLLGVFQLGFSYILFAEASRYLSPIDSILITVIEPLLNPIWVFLFTGEAPGIWAVMGGIVVISAVLVRGLIVAKELNLLKEKKDDKIQTDEKVFAAN